MATIKDERTRASGYCDEMLSELAYMIQTVDELKVHAADTFGGDSEVARIHARHLTDIAEYLDWKLEILTKACPFEWKGLGETVEDVVSVRPPELSGPDFAGGYVGG